MVYTHTTKPQGLTLQEILDMIKEHPKSGYYRKALTRRLTLGDALAQSRLSDIGKVMDFNIGLNLITQDHDRTFRKMPQTGSQLLSKRFKSEPRRV